MRSLFAPLIALACGVCNAAAMSPDPTGLWLDPAESGWGLSLAQQGDVVFATLFVYDDAHRPAWYVAPGVRDDGRETFAAAEPVFVGPLYRTAGPVFSGAFDPHAVSATAVGDIQLQYVAGNGGKALQLAYNLDGVHVVKTLQPQSWGDDGALFAGHYVGAAPKLAASPSSCDPLVLATPNPLLPFGFTVAAGPGPREIQVTWGTGIDVVCSLDGTYAQRGQLGTVTGAIGCFPLGFTPQRDVGAELTELAIGPHGFTGLATFRQGSCAYTAHFGGVRQP
jgi:hypothetical protein